MQVKQWVDAADTPGALNRVLSLQLEAFWQQHGNTLMVVGALAAAYALWWVASNRLPGNWVLFQWQTLGVC